MLQENTDVLPGVNHLNLLGVQYTHLKTRDEGDLYVTKYGLPFAQNLLPENWHEREWFETNREKLEGTSTVYRVKTKSVNGVSKDIVVKWCRVGEQVPIDTFTLNKFVEAEFNSPYEEFSLVMEMRDERSPLIRTHRPLAIYVPAKRLKLWQTGRSQSRMDQKKAKYRDVELDIYRQYILIYEWVKGVSSDEVFQRLEPDEDRRRQTLASLTHRVVRELSGKGFRVLDIKPQHFILRPTNSGDVLRDRDGNPIYALVDFELLNRTPEHEREVVASRRANYLEHQKRRFDTAPSVSFPEHLKPVNVLGVDYVHGHTESTQGQLWVVGRDPALFDYFLPERWRRTTRSKISDANQVYRTKTKDNISLVWKVSRVGERPDCDENSDGGRRIIAHGYNSPFEEFAFAIRLSHAGINTTYPRAIYMTGQETSAEAFDQSRFESHRGILTPDGLPTLPRDHNYITVWGYWNGLDEVLAGRDAEYCTGVNLRDAENMNLISARQREHLLERMKADLAAVGVEDLNMKSSHVLLTLTAQGALLKREDGELALRLSNFSLLRFNAL